MKKLLAVLAISPMLAAAPAAADYRACMEFCTNEHGFAHCNNVRRGPADKTPTVESEAGKSQPPVSKISRPEIPVELIGEDCRTRKGKAWNLVKLVSKRYEEALYIAIYLTLDEDTFKPYFFLKSRKQECTPVVKITDDCRVSGFGKLNCVFADY